MNSVLRAGVVIVLMLVSAGVWATREEKTFHVSVTIPTHEFHVLPVDPLFLEREQVMHWNAVTEQLSSLRAQFDVKNASGGISARLAAEPYLSNGRERIDLEIRFNRQRLSLLDTLVVDPEQARIGHRVTLDIAAPKAAEGFLPGHYYGTVHLIFDAVNP